MPEITLAAAAARLGCSPATLRHQAQRGSLRARLLGKVWVVTEREVERYRREHLGRRQPVVETAEPEEGCPYCGQVDPEPETHLAAGRCKVEP